ncbi:kinetochore Spc25 [Labeo rohita]|uniref:Kinetochore Spc25 n=1 Tax=Labeo rohita TaxID=84645 RepID=A0A498NWG3_LABRO|nr:kinetochore Spc25 [Labeo rohita]
MANMRPVQARFPHPKSRTWTLQHPSNRDKDDGNRAQLDHILINGKWIMSVENIRAYNTVECGSDHRIVSARIKIKLRVERQNKCTRTKFDWAKLKASEQLQAQFNVAVRNRFLALQEECGDSGLQAKYNSFERIREPIDKILRPNQAGFRRGRSCTEQVHIICRLIESADDKNLSLYITFVDFKKAFDSIDRRKMFEILHHYGIPDKLVRAIKTIYNNSKSAVLVEGGLTEEFEITTGVLQGDTLAPFLFIIVIDYVLKNAELNHATIHGINEGENGFVTQPRQCRRQPVTAIFDLDFADDLALLEGNLERAQSQLNEIAKQAEQVGLVVNLRMASIRDYNAVEHFNRRLEEMRSKLLDQALGEELNDRVAQLCQEHRQYMKSVLDTCVKKCKEDETMFDMIQTYKEDLKENTSLLKEKSAEHIEVVSEIEDKEHHKALLFQRIEKLKKDQAKNRELIQSQNKANKDRLKKLNKCKDIFQKHLSLEIRKIQVMSCDPPLEKMAHLERRLQETNNFSAFLANVRREFVALHGGAKTA